MTDKIRQAFEAWWKRHQLSSSSMDQDDAIYSFKYGYKSRDTEVKELEEAVEEEMGHVNRLIEENKLLRDALEYVANGGSKPSMMARKTLNMIGKE